MRLFVSALIGVLVACTASLAGPQGVPVFVQGRTMGTTYLVRVAGAHLSDGDIDLLKRKIDGVLVEINRQMSTYDPSSEISRFNSHRSVAPFPVSPEFVSVLRTALQIHRESEGAFDVTVGPLVMLWGFGRGGPVERPPEKEEIDRTRARVGSGYVRIVDGRSIAKLRPGVEIDFGALAKGYGVDAVSGMLVEAGFGDHMVEIGGEVRVRGLNGGRKWRIGIDRPGFNRVPGEEVQAVLALSDAAVATSGDYRNYFVFEGRKYAHILDPKTGYPAANPIASTSIIAPDCMVADAIATAAMVMGVEKAFEWIESRPGVEALIILRDGDTYLERETAGFKRFVNRE